jgi:maleate isomerase
VTARLGVLVPAGNPTIEPELYRMAPPGLTIHFARLSSLAGDPGAADGMERRTLGYLDSVPEAVRTLADLRPGVIALAHTAVSYLTGYAGEAELVARLGGLTSARPLTAAGAILAVLGHLGVRRVALATPYPEVIASAGRRYWEAAGLQIVSHRGLPGVTNIYEETETRAYYLGRSADSRDAEAILISGTGLPTAGIVEQLEQTLGKPVITSQTATLWQSLNLMSMKTAVRGFGSLLAGTDLRR